MGNKIRSAEMNQEERRIVLLGKSGVGKSATGNTILGRRDAFRSERSFNSVTEYCELAEAVIAGKRVRVVDTPGFFDTKLSRDQLARELCRSVYLSQPGVHAFILVFKYERFTEQEEEMIKRLQEVFGERVTNHTILLFTHAEGVKRKKIYEEIMTNQHLRRVLDQCGGRFHFINNRNLNNRQQVTEVLQKIDRMVQQNKGGFYTNEVYAEAQSSTWEEFWEKFKTMFYIGVSTLALTAAAVAVEYVVPRNTAELIKGLMTLWVKGMIEVESDLTWEIVFTDDLPAAVAAVAVAAVAASGKSKIL